MSVANPLDGRTEPKQPIAPILAARDISVRFGGVSALTEVDIEVAPEAIVGLIGPNGAGKTTLLSVLSGLRRPRGGQVFLEGMDVTDVPAHRRARAGLARTFQLPELFAGLTVREHLSLPWRLRFDRSRLWRDLVNARGWRRPPSSERERVGELLEWLGLTRLAGAPVAGLSLGHSRLVEVGRALAGSPKVVLLDEPLSGLDAAESVHLAMTLHRLVDNEKVSFLLVDHDVDLVLARSTRVFVLDFGELIAHGTSEEIRNNEAVRIAYLGSKVGDEHPSGVSGSSR